MSHTDELSRLLEAERAEHATSVGAGDGWKRLESALAAGTPPAAVSLAPLSLGVPALMKWGVGGGALAVVAGATVLTQVPAEPPRHAPLHAPSAVSVPTARPAPEPQPVATENRTPAPKPLLSANPAERSAAFAEELRLVKLAKSEIDAGRAHLAEVWLDEHARRFPSGVFRAERDALRILVACSAEPTGGAARARDFVRVNPRSPLVDRISRACGLGDAAADEPNIEK